MPARLHHEQIARSDAPPPARWFLLTHGIFGAGSNWRGIARKVNERRPEWGIVLVDLRQHGRSEPGEPPHTVAACAADVCALVGELRGAVGEVAALGGHSFGGKVVLAARAQLAVAQTWVLDSSPSRRDLAGDPTSALAVLELLERLPATWAKRDDFIAAVVAAGHSLPLAQWLGMNVVPDGAAYRLRLDTAAVRQLLEDYCAVDLWDTLLDPARGAVEMVVAERSGTVSAADRARLVQAPPHVHTHMVPADHWLHIEAAAAVVDLLATQLPAGDA